MALQLIGNISYEMMELLLQAPDYRDMTLEQLPTWNHRFLKQAEIELEESKRPVYYPAFLIEKNRLTMEMRSLLELIKK